MGVCVARMVASLLEQLPVSSGNKVARLLPQCCTVAEVTNRRCKGQTCLRIAAKALNSFTGTAGRPVLLRTAHTGPRADCKLLDQTCLRQLWRNW